MDRSDGKSSPAGACQLSPGRKRWAAWDEQAKSRRDDRILKRLVSAGEAKWNGSSCFSGWHAFRNKLNSSTLAELQKCEPGSFDSYQLKGFPKLWPAG